MATAAYSPLGVRLTNYIPHYPEPPQEAFLYLDCLEALYGGAAGGGKSDALLMGALQYADVPGYAAILFRRTYADLSLPGALMDRSKQWLAGTDARWMDVDKTWRFPSGATLSFGYLQTANDKYRYQSAEFQFVGFDELTQFPKDDYLYLFSRLRRPEGSPVPLRMRAATNPGGAGHRWVRQRFITKEPDPDVVETEAERRARIFIPAKLADNPNVDQQAYREALGQLDPQTREQLLNGDWNVRPPGAWVLDQHGIDAAEQLGKQWRPLLDQGSFPPPAGERLSIGIDWGETTQAYTIWPLEQGGIYVPPSETVARHCEPGEATGHMLHQALKFGHSVGSASYDAAGVQSMRTFTAIARQQIPHLRTVSIPFAKYKRETVNYLRLLFRRAGEGHSTRIIAIDPGNVELLRQLRGWQLKDADADDILKGDDHGPDALIAGVAPVASRYRTTTT